MLFLLWINGILNSRILLLLFYKIVQIVLLNFLSHGPLKVLGLPPSKTGKHIYFGDNGLSLDY